MKRKIILLPLLYLFFSQNVIAQILNKAIATINSFDNIKYTSFLREKDLFSDNIYSDTIRAAIAFLEKNNNTKDVFLLQETKQAEVFDGNKVVTLNLLDSTYRVSNSTLNSLFNYRSLSYIIINLKEDIKRQIPINQLADSTIKGRSFYQLKITELDSIKDKKHVYRFVTVLLDKTTYLPYSYRTDQQGFVDGTDMFVDTFSEYRFEDYQVNTKTFPDLTLIQIPNGFTIVKAKEPLALLAKDTKAPEIAINDSLGNPFSIQNKKGKIVLLNFSLIGCPHCVESIKMLNKLYSIYGHNLVIVTINPFDNKESIQKSNIRFSVNYPTYENTSDGSQNINNYHVESYPTFYLINKKGDIVKGFEGYYKLLDDELTELINKTL